MGNPFSFKTLQQSVDQRRLHPPRRAVHKYDDKGQLVKVKGMMEPKQRSTRRTGKRAR